MPFVDAGFQGEDGKPDVHKLLAHGPTLQVTVATYPAPEDISKVRSKPVYALVDTGATYCMIDNKLADELGLIAIDKAQISGVTGIVEHPVYMAAIIVPHLENHQYGRFVAGSLNETGETHDVLLGRDFLSNTIMIYDGIRGQITIGV